MATGLCIIEGQSWSHTVNLGSGTSFDVSSYPNYQNFTVENFVITSIAIKIQGIFQAQAGMTQSTGYVDVNALELSYDNSTGTLTVTGTEPSVMVNGESAGYRYDVGGAAKLTPTVKLIY